MQVWKDHFTLNLDSVFYMTQVRHEQTVTGHCLCSGNSLLQFTCCVLKHTQYDAITARHEVQLFVHAVCCKKDSSFCRLQLLTEVYTLQHHCSSCMSHPC